MLTGVVGLDDDGGASTRIPGDVFGMNDADESSVGEVDPKRDKGLGPHRVTKSFEGHGESR